MDNRYVKPIIPILIALVIVAALFYAGGVVDALKNEAPIGEALSGITGRALQGDTGSFLGGWLFWLLVAGVGAYVVYQLFADTEYWKVGTLEVVMMALGAALYGFLSLAFNTIPVPSVSLVALRPVVVIPIFFGAAFGPVVGFFAGAVGNILGDALTGWGVYPAWDLGNGLMGLIPGLAAVYFARSKPVSGRTLLIVIAVLLLVATLLPVLFPNIVSPWTGEMTTEYSAWWPFMLAAAAMFLVLALVPRVLPAALALMFLGLLFYGIWSFIQEGFNWGAVILLVWATLVGLLSFFLWRRAASLTAWLADEDTRRIVVWGSLAVIVGMGFAAFADIFINGYSVPTALIGEFIPAAAPNILFAVILTPLLFGAWKQARAQVGR